VVEKDCAGVLTTLYQKRVRAFKVVERLVYTHFQTVFAFCIRPSEIANNIAPQRGKGAEAAINHSISRHRKIPQQYHTAVHMALSRELLVTMSPNCLIFLDFEGLGVESNHANVAPIVE
jgi:hypothetical protein